jgi:outer membrane receptor protein involved in Fe transport
MIAKVLRCVGIAAIVAACGTPCWGQTAQITGRVTDSSEAVVPEAQVWIINEGTGIRRDTATSGTGYFTAALLQPGKYRVTVEKTGFRPVTRADINLDAGQVARVDFVLQVGPLTESVTVEAGGQLLETSTASVSTVVPRQRILDLPLIGRNPIALAGLVPGVRPVGGFGSLPTSSYSNAAVNIGGGPPNANNYTIDGVPTENFTSGGMNVFLSVDAVEEFRIIVRNPSAEYGRTGGGVISILSRSGTNEFHASAYEFLRNKVLNANSYFNNQQGVERSPFVFNQYGATLGGPLKKNQTFFFFNWEQFKQRTSAETFRTVPTATQRQGDFRETRTADGRMITVYDPLTTREDPRNPAAKIRDPFPGNVIAPQRIHPVSRAVLNYYPAPNAAGVPVTGARNFYGQASAPVDKNILGIKIDHNFNPVRRLSGRYTYDFTDLGIANFYGNVAEINASPTEYTRNSVALNYTDSIRPNLLLEARAGVNRYAPFRIQRSYPFDISTIGLSASLGAQMQVPVFPRFSVGDVSDVGAPQTDHLKQANEAWSVSASLTKYHGAHVLKAGVEQRWYRLNNTQGGPSMQFSFGRYFTQGPNPLAASSAAGYGLASFLVGTPRSGSAARWPTSTFTVPNFAAFVQDDWKVTPKLTLNLGLRWEVEGAFTDRFNALTNFDPNLKYQADGINFRGGAIFPGVNGVPRGNRDIGYKDFEPRFGFAYQVLPRTVLRGGYGITHLPTTGVYFVPGREGHFSNTPLVGVIEAGIPNDTLDNPFPTGIQAPTGSTLGPLTNLGRGITADMRSLGRGYSQQWNLNVQRDLPGNLLLEVGYLGNHGVSLPAYREYNFVTPEVRAMGDAALELVPNPYYGLVDVGIYSEPEIERYRLLKDYPQLTSVYNLQSWANSNYHALAVRLERRFSHGFSLLAAYTFSKLIDDNLGAGQFPDNWSPAPEEVHYVQDWANLRAERSVSGNNLPQRLVTTATWQLPFGNSGSPFRRGLLGGWQVNSILTLQSGAPIGVVADEVELGGFRPNVAGDPVVNNPSLGRWFNTAAFTQIDPFTMGNAPRVLPRNRTDSLFNWDLSFFRRFRIREKASLELRGEFFNVTNTPTFGMPGIYLSDGDFGAVTSTSSSPRNVQLGLKLYF